MKQILAVIKLNVVEQVIHLLRQLPQFTGYTMLHVHGEGRGRGLEKAWVASEDAIDTHPHTMLLIACRDDAVDGIVNAVQTAAHTGLAGDGLILVSDVLHATRIGTGEHNNAAL